MKTIEQCQKAVAKAISRAYNVRLYPDEISRDHVGRDPRSFILKHAGMPHADLSVQDVAALALSRAEKMTGDEALASTVADLYDGGISLDRQAAAPRDLDALMSKHRALRALKNPLPVDKKAQVRAKAPGVIRRSGASARRPPPPPPLRISVGHHVRYRRLDDDSEHVVSIGATQEKHGTESVRVLPPGSPLAVALRGGTVGTIVTATLGGTPVELEVVEVTVPSA